LNVTFWNSRGLGVQTRKVVFDAIWNRQVDIFIVCETWGMHRRYKDGLQTMLVADTPPILRAGTTNGREKGGLAVFSHPDFHKHISILQFTQDTLSICIDHNTLSAVYLPPSMTDDKVSTVMENLPPSSLVVGDLNCRFSGINGATADTPRTRGRVLAQWSAARSLRVQQTTSPVSQIDHLLLSSNRDGTAALQHTTNIQMGANSDHGALHFLWQIQSTNTQHTPTTRKPNLCLRHINHKNASPVRSYF
jgi:hypothetical protein